MFLLRTEFGEDFAHGAGEDIDEFVEEGFVQAERAAVADGAAQDAAKDIIAVGVAGLDAIGDGEREGADVVGDDAEGDIGFFLLGVAGGAADGECRAVGAAAEFFDFVEDRAEDVGLVVRNARVGEIGEVFCALDDRGDAFEAHAGIDMARGEGGERAVGVRVELDEDEVPNLDALGGAFVDEGAAGVAGGGEVDMEFRAGAAGAGFAHHPEVVFFVSVDDVNGGIESGGAEFFGPEIPSLLVARGGVAGFGVVDRGVEAGGGEFPAVDDEFPRPVDGFLFEVVAEGPVPQHLEKGVVVGVEADIIEVVVFAAGADAFLRVCRALVGAGKRARPFGDIRGFLAEEDGDELVHAGVRKEEVRRVGHETRGGDDRVLFFAEEIEERLADLG